MKYIYMRDGKVAEIIPETNSVFPQFTLAQRYSKEFIDKLIPVEDDAEVEQNWTYDGKEFHAPVVVEPEEVDAEESEAEKQPVAQ